MKIKMIYQIGAFYYEAECLNEQERKEAVKGLIYATKDLNEAYLLGQPEMCQNEPVYQECNVEENTVQQQPVQQQPVQQEPVQQAVEYATPGQKNYMAKLGISFNDYTTKIEAIDMINNWKVQHGIPISGKNLKV